MKFISLFVLSVMLAGCEPITYEQAAQLKLDRPWVGVRVEHDDARSVTCWVPSDDRAGLSCLPDWMLVKPEKAQ
jgi:hypothetical protein